MRKHFFSFNTAFFVCFAILFGCMFFSGDNSPLLAIVIAGVAGGRHIDDEPLTTDLTRDASPNLLLNEIDQQIVKIRPMATPIDQISRLAASKPAGSMIVDYYNVDTKPTTAEVATEYVEPAAGSATADDTRITLSTSNDEMFDVSDTILVQGVYGYDASGTRQSTNSHGTRSHRARCDVTAV